MTGDATFVDQLKGTLADRAGAVMQTRERRAGIPSYQFIEKAVLRDDVTDLAHLCAMRGAAGIKDYWVVNTDSKAGTGLEQKYRVEVFPPKEGDPSAEVAVNVSLADRRVGQLKAKTMGDWPDGVPLTGNESGELSQRSGAWVSLMSDAVKQAASEITRK